MYGTVALSTETIDQIVLEDKNAHLEHMNRLIGNAERHGEKSVVRELSRTLDEMTLSIAM